MSARNCIDSYHKQDGSATKEVALKALIGDPTRGVHILELISEPGAPRLTTLLPVLPIPASANQYLRVSIVRVKNYARHRGELSQPENKQPERE